MARFFDNTTWELETKLWLAYLYSINIIRSKKLHKNLFITKSRDFKSVFLSGQASREYSKIGRHLLLTNCSRTSSEDVRPTLPKIALTTRFYSCKPVAAKFGRIFNCDAKHTWVCGLTLHAETESLSVCHSRSVVQDGYFSMNLMTLNSEYRFWLIPAFINFDP